MREKEQGRTNKVVRISYLLRGWNFPTGGRGWCSRPEFQKQFFKS